MLIGGRILQGVGAAPMLPLSLAIVCNAFPAAEQAAGARDLGGGLGDRAGDRAARRRRADRNRLAGDLLDQPAGRRRSGSRSPSVAAPESTDPGPARRIDFAGLVALGVGLTAVVLALVQSRAWAAAAVVALAVVGVLRSHRASGGSSTGSASRSSTSTLFRNGPYFGASAAAFALVGAYWAVMFFQPQYLQDVRGHSAVLAG